MDAAHISETSVNFYQTAQWNIPEDQPSSANTHFSRSSSGCPLSGNIADMAWNITVCGNGLAAVAAPPNDPDLDPPVPPRLPNAAPTQTDFSFSFSFPSLSPPFSWFASSWK
jgi:hypothetical protein